MVSAWPSEVPGFFVRSTYQRTPEDIVRRKEVDIGPPLRNLITATRAQTVKGELSFSINDKSVFEDWRQQTLNRGRDPFAFTLYDHAAPRSLTMRLIGSPIYRHISLSRIRAAVEFRADPPDPVPAKLVALADLNKADPVDWPVDLPACTRLDSYEAQPITVIERPEDLAPVGGALLTRQEGISERVGLTLSSAELEAFETWFETDAAFGARDIRFKLGEVYHRGCFSGPYTVSGLQNRNAWNVTFERYLEARA